MQHKRRKKKFRPVWLKNFTGRISFGEISVNGKGVEVTLK